MSLARHGNIPISDSEHMPDYERELYLNILADSIREENKALKKKQSKQ